MQGRCFVILAVMLCCLGGCSSTAGGKLPRENLRPITKFSLGSAHCPQLKNRPSGKQLYDAALRLFDSFDTAEFTGRRNGEIVVTPMNGSVKGVPEVQRIQATHHYRAANPDRALTLTKLGDRPPYVIVHDDRNILHYEVNSGDYGKYGWRGQWPSGHSAVVGLLGLVMEPPARITRYKLLPDTKIGGTDVYVLELTYGDVDNQGDEKEVRRVYRYYLGKRDLLPRRVETDTLRKSSHKWTREISNEEYTGFVANAALPKDLFSTVPPAGARNTYHGSSDGK